MDYYILRKSDEELVDIKSFTNKEELNKYLKQHKKLFAYPVEELESTLNEFTYLFNDDY